MFERCNGTGRLLPEQKSAEHLPSVRNPNWKRSGLRAEEGLRGTLSTQRCSPAERVSFPECAPIFELKSRAPDFWVTHANDLIGIGGFGGRMN